MQTNFVILLWLETEDRTAIATKKWNQQQDTVWIRCVAIYSVRIHSSRFVLLSIASDGPEKRHILRKNISKHVHRCFDSSFWSRKFCKWNNLIRFLGKSNTQGIYDCFGWWFYDYGTGSHNRRKSQRSAIPLSNNDNWCIAWPWVEYRNMPVKIVFNINLLHNSSKHSHINR